MKWIKKYLTAISIASIVFLLGSINFTFAASPPDPPTEKTVEGVGYFYNTGDSYPTDIVIVGFDARANKMYLNFKLETGLTCDPATDTATYKYYIDIYNGSGVEVGHLGDYTTPQSKTNDAGVSTATIVNEEVTLSAPPLTALYRIIITVKEVLIT